MFKVVQSMYSKIRMKRRALIEEFDKEEGKPSKRITKMATANIKKMERKSIYSYQF